MDNESEGIEYWSGDNDDGDDINDVMHDFTISPSATRMLRNKMS